MTNMKVGLSGLKGAPEAASQGQKTNAAVLGDVVFLMLHSPIHRGWPVAMVEANILPPIHHKQFRLYHDEKGMPIGFVSWAWLSDELDQRYAAGNYKLKPMEWKSGPHAWIIDFITPFGHAMAVRRHLWRDQVFLPTGVCKAFRKVKGEDAIWVMQFGSRRGRKASGFKNFKRPIVKPPAAQRQSS